ncbi:MAG: AMP-binding protein [Bacteroidota bacterium]|nr:AMP-binding protein [Bacteroidota bacterium]
MPHIEEPILLDGDAFTKSEVLDYCRKQGEEPGVASWRKEVLDFIVLFLDPSGGLIMQKSSGSTGDPKTFQLSREAMMLSAQRTLRFFDLKRGEVALLALPVHYIAGKMMVVRALVGGLDLRLVKPSSRPLLSLSGPVAFAAMVPLQIEESLNHGDPLNRISKLLIGGGELHPATRESLSSMHAPEVYESFGMTETYTHFALKRINGPHKHSGFRLLEGVRVGVDPRGCLEVEIPGITSGALLTNDLVEINPQGDGFTWLGRFDNVINTGGIKIIPELLEAQIGNIIGQECLVLPEADRKLGNRLVLLVEFEGTPPVDTWLNLLRNNLSNYELPRRIIAVPSLPRNLSMKPDRTSAMERLL